MTDSNGPVDDLSVERWLRSARTATDTALAELDDSWTDGLEALRDEASVSSRQAPTLAMVQRRRRPGRPRPLMVLLPLAATVAGALVLTSTNDDPRLTGSAIEPLPQIPGELVDGPVVAVFALRPCTDCGAPGIELVADVDAGTPAPVLEDASIETSVPRAQSTPTTLGTTPEDPTGPRPIAAATSAPPADSMLPTTGTVAAEVREDGTLEIKGAELDPDMTYLVSVEQPLVEVTLELGTLVGGQSVTYQLPTLGDRAQVVVSAKSGSLTSPTTTVPAGRALSTTTTPTATSTTIPRSTTTAAKPSTSASEAS